MKYFFRVFPSEEDTVSQSWFKIFAVSFKSPQCHHPCGVIKTAETIFAVSLTQLGTEPSLRCH
jgi:hypothetical protein